jgi:hypothetical protein
MTDVFVARLQMACNDATRVMQIYRKNGSPQKADAGCARHGNIKSTSFFGKKNK